MERPFDPYSVVCGRGWHGLVAELDSRLAALDPGYTVFQVKQKFGELQFHAHPSMMGVVGRDEFDRAIMEARAVAARTCEECGKPGTRHVVRGWIAVLCDLDHQAYLDEG